MYQKHPSIPPSSMYVACIPSYLSQPIITLCKKWVCLPGCRRHCDRGICQGFRQQSVPWYQCTGPTVVYCQKLRPGCQALCERRRHAMLSNLTIPRRISSSLDTHGLSPYLILYSGHNNQSYSGIVLQNSANIIDAIFYTIVLLSLAMQAKNGIWSCPK